MKKNREMHRLPSMKEELQKIELIKAHASEMAHNIDNLVPDGREKSMALTKMEEVVMWAKAGIKKDCLIDLYDYSIEGLTELLKTCYREEYGAEDVKILVQTSNRL